MKVQEMPNIYSQAQRFADLTKSLIKSGHLRSAKRCLQKAEALFLSGSLETRNVISNVYLYSVSTFMENHSCRIKGLLPIGLQIEYNKQINASGL
jgi:hypothetical protein